MPSRQPGSDEFDIVRQGTNRDPVMATVTMGNSSDAASWQCRDGKAGFRTLSRSSDDIEEVIAHPVRSPAGRIKPAGP